MPLSKPPTHHGAPLVRSVVSPTLQSIGSNRAAGNPASDDVPMSTSGSAGSSASSGPALALTVGLLSGRCRKSSAYQSLQASPMAPACAVDRAPEPSSLVTSRFDRPCVYSCHTVPASSPPFMFRNVNVPDGLVANRYICIRGLVPSGGVDMFALLVW